MHDAPCKSAEAHQHPGSIEHLQFRFEPRHTSISLGRRRFVGRRCTAHRGSHPGILQDQPIIPIYRGRLGGEPGPVEGPIQPISGAITGEHAARAIRAMGCGGESDDYQPCHRVTEPWHGLAPVDLLRVSSPLLLGNRLPPLHEPGTAPTADDL